MIKILSAAIVAFCVCAAVMPLVIMLGKKLKVRQTILSYVDNHISKSGTPTMGGIGVMIALTAGCLIFGGGDYKQMLVTLFVTLGYGV
ncbi:MAG: phospho-N-acetylmuramoyl-pentapeptide-transferase, partial [Clostridia bacterium]|nr:phospho-N-acetylmuramoyl-pentapeptide-transferase [Clostridia bacterium]